MEKVIVVLQTSNPDDSWCRRLREPVADELLTLGLPGVVLNVCDAPVRNSMLRISTLTPPAAAVVSVWTHQYYGDQVRSAVTLLAAESDSAAAYLVTESTPMPPPDPGNGQRTPGLANIAFLRRPDWLDHQSWLRRWHLEHTPVAIETQATFGYTQNVVVRALTDGAPVIDGIVEENFPDDAVTDPMAFYGAIDQADLRCRVERMIASCNTFGAAEGIDTVPTSRYALRSPFWPRG